MRQLSLFPKQQSCFGGSLSKNKRKEARPLSTKNPIHLILKSTSAWGDLSFTNNETSLKRLLQTAAKKYGVVIYQSVFNGNHVHLIIKISSRASYKAWVRAWTSSIVAHLQKKFKKSLKGFFDLLPFTRIGSWGREYRELKVYLEKNEMEKVGLRPAKKVPGLRRSKIIE